MNAVIVISRYVYRVGNKSPMTHDPMTRKKVA